MRLLPDDAACAAYLEKVRWPGGFVCQYCGLHDEPSRFPNRSFVVLRCRSCKRDTSLTADTVMQRTHMPISIWFWAAYLVSSQTPGMSAVQFQRQLGLKRYETAFQILHKLRVAMVRLIVTASEVASRSRSTRRGSGAVRAAKGADGTTRRWSSAPSRSASAK